MTHRQLQLIPIGPGPPLSDYKIYDGRTSKSTSYGLVEVSQWKPYGNPCNPNEQDWQQEIDNFNSRGHHERGSDVEEHHINDFNVNLDKNDPLLCNIYS